MLELVIRGEGYFFQDILQVGRAAGMNELWFTPRMLSVKWRHSGQPLNSLCGLYYVSQRDTSSTLPKETGIC